MAAAKRAAIGQQDPVQGALQGVADAYASKVDRSAMRTACCHLPVTPFKASLPNHQFSPHCPSQGRGCLEWMAQGYAS